MSQITLISIASSVFFGLIAIYISFKEERFKRDLKTPGNIFTKGKDDFMHMMIHELRAPLTAIKGAADLVLNSQNKLSPDESIKMVQLIEQQSTKLLEQVSSLLDLAKIQASQFTIQKTSVDVGKLVQDATAVFLPQSRVKNVSLVTDIQSNLPLVMGDQLRLGQVINNLVSNSLKFTPTGGTITVSVKKTDTNHVILSVSDTGIGIEEAKQKDLFTKFYQVNHDNNTPGTGLGLYIVKHIVEAHGGTIQLSSAVGKGTTITLTLPI